MPARQHTERDDLDALIATETRLEQLLEAARVEAEARVDYARVRAAEQGAELQARMTAAIEQVEREIDATTKARIEQARADAATVVARYEAIEGDALAKLAAQVAEDLVALVIGGPR